MVRGSNKYFNSHLGRVTLELNLKVKDHYQTHLENKETGPNFLFLYNRNFK